MSFTTLWYFFTSSEFKCMQRSKPPFGRERWCNKQKLTDYSHSSPLPLQFSFSVPRGHRDVPAKCHQGAGVLSSVFHLALCIMLSFREFVCLLRMNLNSGNYRHKFIDALYMIDFISQNIEVNTILVNTKMPHNLVALWAWWHCIFFPLNVLICYLELTSQGHNIPFPHHSSLAPLDQSSAAPNSLSQQLQICRLPVYSRLLMVTH